MTTPETPATPEDPGGFLRREVLVRGALAGAGLAATTLIEACAPLGENDRLGKPIVSHVAMETREVVRRADLLQAGPWQYMNGVRVAGDSLELRPTDLAIVDKRAGGVIRPNPPLEVFGPRLQAAGDFSVSMRVESATPVSVQFYGEVPIRFDDFRYERARVGCIVTGDTLTAQIWDGSSQEPSITQRFPFDGSPTDRHIELRREGHELSFVVNGERVGSLPEQGVFKAGAVWLGINSEQGLARVSELIAGPLHGHKLATVDTASLRITRPLPEGLQTLVRRPNFRIGAAAAINPMMSDPRYAELFLGGEIGSITTENCLKPQDVQPTEGVFTFGEADALVQVAARNGLVVHGHTLVYDKAMPKWMQELPSATATDKQRVREVLEHHVRTVVGHFRGRITSWDVVNEAISGFNTAAGLEDNIWLRALGEEYIDIAFRAAHAADPSARLFINDYGMETNPQGRGRFMIDLVKRLQACGVPIHGVGTEGHVYEIPRDTIYPKTLRQLMDDFHRLGMYVRVSELDVTGANGAQVQARQYADVLRVALQAPNCVGVTMWGLNDLYGSTAGLRHGRLQPGDALPYTVGYRPKLARRAMRSVLRNRD